MNWPPAGARAGSGVIRRRPEDFQVVEQLGFHPAGEGEHVFIEIEKSGANTGWVAGQLARACGVRRRDVSFAGRKDRHAVCRQWFSVHLPGQPTPGLESIAIEGVRLVSVTRHTRKLRRGALAANQFVITVRALDAEAALLEQRLTQVSQHGVPNYFGAQRFGRNGANLEQARALFAGNTRLKREQRSLALSAARALIFNAVLAARVKDGSWNTPLPGDCLSLDGSNAFFLCERPGVDEAARMARGDIHVSGPLWGAGELPTRAVVAQLETKVAEGHAGLCSGLEKAGLSQERRPLRLVPRAMQWQSTGDGLRLAFRLPRGAFATAVLAEILDIDDAAAGGKPASAVPNGAAPH